MANDGSAPNDSWEILTFVDIRLDDLRGPDIAQLLQEHLSSMAMLSPPESVHALDLEKLRQPDITFWCAWQDKELLGCGALKELDPTHGEIKSMRTASKHLRKGVAVGMLKHIIEEAHRRQYRRLSLETGTAEAFAPAHNLYTRLGFQACGPFGGYIEDPHSVFMNRDL